MSWSFRIGRVAGIPIYVHWTFLILLGWIAFAYWRQGNDLATTLEGVGFVLAIFGCVVLHELGHALAARRYGVPTADITLLPIGGVARLQRIPEHPGQELVVAIAGPMVNVGIVLVLWLLGVRPVVQVSETEFLFQETFLTRLMIVNVFLVLFNLLPAFPMDGGRVLRALLAMTMEYGRATRIAASVGQFMAILFGFLGLSGNPMLLLIALFVWIGAEAEAAQVQERLVLKNVPVREAMLTEFTVLAPTDTLGHAADLLLAGSQQDFPVVADGRPRGVLTRAALLAGLAQRGRDALVGELPLAELGQVDAASPLVPAVARLRERGEPCLQVVDHGEPVGLLTLENIGEYLMVRTALAEAAAQR
jgi:Zn-dependent protease